MNIRETKEHLAKLMSNNGPNLRVVIEALAEVCYNRAELDQEHVLTREQAVGVWKPTGDALMRVKTFVEEARRTVPIREISLGESHED